MSRSTLEEAKAAWGSAYDGLSQAEIDRRVLGLTALVRGIAEKGSITPEEFSRDTALDTNQANELFSALAGFGLERDESGRIVGAALTTKRTPHSIAVRGKQLFAWCALDTLFIPGLLNQVAEVESTCPVSHTPIRLSVTRDGVRSFSPPDAVLTVVLPGVGSSTATTGPASPT